MQSDRTPNGLCRGDVVRVRSREEILATLDERGCVDGLPFMPEMLEHCGRVYRVQARAHKTCDTIQKTGGRWMKDAVHLEGLRCDGSAHGGCEAACLLFFKNVWLERASESELSRDGRGARGPEPAPPASRATRGWDETRLRAAARRDESPSDASSDGATWVCQTTELYRATSLVPWWDLRQYVEDVRSGNVSLGSMLNRLYFRFTANMMAHGRGYKLWHALYDAIQRRLGNPPFPIIEGQLKKTPSEHLGLVPGDVVEVKSLDEIVATLDTRNRNRGMAFDKEQAVFCGQRHVVEGRVTKIIEESTGRMMQLPNDCIVLKGVACTSVYSEKRIACPRAIPSYWRECWLRRVEP